MNYVMRLQWEEVKDDRVLLAAWRKGDAYWKDHFGAAAVKELFGYLRSGQLWQAAAAGAALTRFVGFRILVLLGNAGRLLNRRTDREISA